MLTETQVQQVRHICRLEQLASAALTVANSGLDENLVCLHVIVRLDVDDSFVAEIKYFDRHGIELGGLAL